MASFEQAIPIILKHEGGFVDDKADPGGATNFGITLLFLQRLLKTRPDIFNHPRLEPLARKGKISAEDIQNLEEDQAALIYKLAIWDALNYSLLNNQALATKIFDACVNLGESQAHKLLQYACNSIVGKQILNPDGILGEKTRGLANSLDALQLLAIYRVLQAEFYKDLVSKRPGSQKFLNGWLKRAAS